VRDVEIWRCGDVDVEMWRCGDVDVEMWRRCGEDEDVEKMKMWRR
jgi:hypothetical protein